MSERDPDTLPDSQDPSGPCPRCGRVAAFLRDSEMTIDSRMVQVGATGAFAQAISKVHLLRCQGCHQGILVVEEFRPHRFIDDEDTPQFENRWHPVHWYPPPGLMDLDESIPVATQLTYGEAMRCMSVKAYRAAAVMLRRTLETVVHDKGSEDARKALERNLAKALEIMATDHALDPTLASWAAEIRLVGNVGAHYDPADDVAKDEADDLQHLTRRLLEYVYEMPARIRRSRPKG